MRNAKFSRNSFIHSKTHTVVYVFAVLANIYVELLSRCASGRKRPAGNKSGIAFSKKLTDFGRAGFSRFVDGMLNVFLVWRLYTFLLCERGQSSCEIG